MVKDRFTEGKSLQKLKWYQIGVYLTCIASILVSVFMDKDNLVYILPVAVLAIGVKHVMLRKKKYSKLYCIVILLIASSDVFSFVDFQEYFVTISTLTTLALFLTSVILLKYIDKIKLHPFKSPSTIIGVCFVGYIIYAVLELLIDYIPENSIFYIFLCASALLVFTGVVAIIYTNDNYTNGVNLFISVIFTFFQIALSPINELFYYNRTFTVLIVICHLLSIYMFMTFISKTKKADPKDHKEKFV